MADSIRISELREAELRAEAAERDALGLPPDYSAPERVVRTYNIDGRERRVVFINTNPIGFGVRLQEYRDKMEQQNLLTGATPPSSSAACTECCESSSAQRADAHTLTPSHSVGAVREVR